MFLTFSDLILNFISNFQYILYRKLNDLEISPPDVSISDVLLNDISTSDVLTSDVSSNGISSNDISAENDLVAECFEEKEMEDKSNLFACRFRY